MTPQPLTEIYQGYLTCLNAQDWGNLGQFVARDVRHNDLPLGLTGYQQMLESDFRAIPDLHFKAEQMVVTPPVLACRLKFDCTPTGHLFGHPVNGRRVRFCEHVFYRFETGHIAEVWSIIDQVAIGCQLATQDCA